MKLVVGDYVTRDFEMLRTVEHAAALAELNNVLDYKYKNPKEAQVKYIELCECAVKTSDFTAYGFIDLFNLWGGSSPFSCSIAMPNFVWTETAKGRDPLNPRESTMEEWEGIGIRKSMRVKLNGRRGFYKVRPLRLPEDDVQAILSDYKGFYDKITKKYPYAFFISPHGDYDLSMFKLGELK